MDNKRIIVKTVKDLHSRKFQKFESFHLFQFLCLFAFQWWEMPRKKW